MAVSPIGAMMSAATAAPVTGTQQLGAAGIPTDTGQAGAAGGSDFGNVVTNALQGMQDSQDNANNLAVQAATGDLTDVHNYTIAATEASLQTEMTVAVRDRAVAAFNQIMSMQI
jgi:flagellar hook-basal body complex protein FliE